jgi:DNA repair protein RecO (recombination protein O)
MASKYIKGEAVVLKRINHKDADRIITIFSYQQGKLNLLAKGARKITSSKLGSMELGSVITYEAVDGYSLPIITELNSKQKLLKGNLDEITLLFYLLELIEKMIPEQEPDEYLYQKLKELLSQDITKKHLQQFQIFLLKHLGFGLPDNPTPHSVNEHLKQVLDLPLYLLS